MGGKTRLTTEKFTKLLRNNETNFKDVKFAEDTHLCFMNLEGLNLKNADMAGVCLHKTILKNANLEGAILSRAALSYTDFTGANLKKIGFSHSTLSYVTLAGAKVSSPMCGTDLSTVIGLDSCDLNNTYFSGTKVTTKQKKDILDRYEIMEIGPNAKAHVPKAPYVRASTQRDAFEIVKESRRKN